MPKSSISSVACRFSYIKIDYSDYPKSFISRINEIYIFFSKKYRYSIFFLTAFIVECCNRLLLQCNVLSCWNGLCDVNVTLSKSMKVCPLCTAGVDSMELADVHAEYDDHWVKNRVKCNSWKTAEVVTANNNTIANVIHKCIVHIYLVLLSPWKYIWTCLIRFSAYNKKANICY